MRKQRPEKKLAFKPGDPRREKIAAWLRTPGLTLHKICEMIQAEYGITTSKSALSRFYEEICEEEAADRVLKASTESRAMAASVKAQGVQISEALENELAQTCFELRLAGAPSKEIAAFVKMFAAVSRENQTKRDFELELQKTLEARKSQQDKALDALFEEIRGNPRAEALIGELRSIAGGASE